MASTLEQAIKYSDPLQFHRGATVFWNGECLSVVWPEVLMDLDLEPSWYIYLNQKNVVSLVECCDALTHSDTV